MRNSIMLAVAALSLAAHAAAQPQKDIGYDPHANALEQRDAAVAEAAASDKLVLLISGGGELLASQNTLPLEDGDKSYDRAKFLAFIEQWRERSARH